MAEIYPKYKSKNNKQLYYLLNYLFLKSKPLNYQLVKRFRSSPTGNRTRIYGLGNRYSIR
jgi:hypothetical protein